MRPGDLLVLLPGNYRQPIVVRRSGTPRDFLHIVAENPPYHTPHKFPTTGQTVIDMAAGDDGPAVLLDGCAHVRVAGLGAINSRVAAAVELRNTRECVVEYVFVEGNERTGIRVTGRGNTLYECRVSGGRAGYELAGSLLDVRWCNSNDNHVGFQTVGPVAGLLLLQNQYHGGPNRGVAGFDCSATSSDIVLDGNWADVCEVGFNVNGQRVMLVNNNADQVGTGIRLKNATDARIFNNNVFRAAHNALVLGDTVGSALVLNNVLQGDEHNLVLDSPAATGPIWVDYNVYSRASTPFRLNAKRGERSFGDLVDWASANGWDRNSRVAPLVYFKQRDRNGRWRVRGACISVTNVTPHFNVGPLGANASPFASGGTYILDLPQNWKAYGDPARRVYQFDIQPFQGALAARADWYLARIDYRRPDGSRSAQDLYRVDLPPDQMPAGSFCQDPATGRVHLRLPLDAQEPCPIGQHLQLSPTEAIGYYVGREVTGAAEKYRGKLIDASLAQTMIQEGIEKLDAVANLLSCVCGSPTFERGCPIQGLCRDADSCAGPSAPLSLTAFGAHNGPGRYDIGAAEHGYYVP